MSEQDFGIFNLLYAFIPVVSTLASLGLEQVLRRFQPEYQERATSPLPRGSRGSSAPRALPWM